MAWIDDDELQALRTLARKALGSSERDRAPDLDFHGQDTPEGPSDEAAPLSVALDVLPTRVHDDWYALTLNERTAMARLAAAYPAHVPHGELLSRFRRTAQSPELEMPLPHAATHISHIRATIGYDAVETVYETRVNRRGAVVRTGRSLGYRLGLRYARELGLTGGGE